MKRKFVNAMLFGSLVLASGSVAVSCSDYDDDIDNLQGQIDGINDVNPVSPGALSEAIASAKAEYEQKLSEAVSGKADDADVQALQSTVSELSAALNGKADAATVENLLAQIGELATRVNNVEGDLGATKTELQDKISEIQNTLSTLDAVTSGELSSIIAEQVNSLNGMIAELRQEMADGDATAAKQTELEALLNRVSEMETAQAGLNTQLSEMQTELMGEINGVLAQVQASATKAEVETLKAELDALIARIDGTEQGDDEQPVAGLDEIRESVSALQGNVDRLSGELADLVARVDGTEQGGDEQQPVAGLDEIRESVAGLVTDLAAVNERLEGISGRMGELSGSLEGVTGTVNGLSEQLTAVSGQMGELSGSLGTLSGELESVKGDVQNLLSLAHLTEDDVRSMIQSELVSSLTEYNNRLVEVENFITNNAENIAKLSSALATIDNMQNVLLPDYEARLALVESGKASQSDLIDLSTTVTTIQQNMPSVIGKYLTDNSYVTLTELQNKLNTQLTDYLKKTDVYSNDEIDQKLNAIKQLGEVKSETLDAVFAGLDTKAENYKTYSEVLASLASLEGKFADEGDVTKLSNSVDSLYNVFNTYVDAVNSAVQSIVYMPDYTDRQVRFNSLVLTAGNRNTAISSTDQQTIKFRVTPAAAAKTLLEKYDLSFLGHQIQSRAIGGNSFIQVAGEPTVSNDGVITIPVTTGSNNTRVNANHYSSICLKATAKEVKTEDGDVVGGLPRVDLTSDYFTLAVVRREVSEVKVLSPVSAAATIPYNAAWSRNYAAGRTFVDQNGASLSDFDMEGIGTVTYSVDNTTQFAMSNGTLNYTRVNEVASIDEEGAVTATYRFNAVPSVSWSNTYNKISIVRAITALTYTYPTTVAVDWTKTNRINLDMVAVQNASGLASADFLALSNPTITNVTVGGQVMASLSGDLSNGLTLNVAQYTNMRNASGTKVSWKYQVNELTTFEIIVNLASTSNFPNVQITRNANWWSGNQMTVPATETVSNNKVTGVNLSDLAYGERAYSNYNAATRQQYASQGLLYSVNVSQPTGVTVDANNETVTVNKSTYNGGTINIKAQIRLDENGQTDELKKDEGTIVVPDLSGDWSVSKTNFTAANLTDAINLAEGCTWMSRSIAALDGKQHVMWKNGKVYGVSPMSNDDVFATNALAIYGLTAPVFTEVAGTDPDNLVTVDRNTGMLTFAPNANDFKLTRDYVIKVNVTVRSQWGKYRNGNTTQLTITIPAQ